MKRIFTVLLFVFCVPLLAAPVCADEEEVDKEAFAWSVYTNCYNFEREPVPEDLPPEVREAVDKLWFPLGESLQYNVKWSFLLVAHSVVTNQLVKENGKIYLSIRFRTKSRGVLDPIYPVDDYIESVIDLETFLPIRFMKVTHEGSYFTWEITTFDHEKQVATWHRLKSDKVEEVAIEPDTRDIISFMYYLRSQDVFAVGEEKPYRVMADEKLYDLFLQAQEADRFRLDDYGWVKSMLFVPDAAFDGLFVRKKGKVWIWVSMDPRQIVTKMKARVPVASISIVISGVAGPGDDFWVNEADYRDEFGVDDQDALYYRQAIE